MPGEYETAVYRWNIEGEVLTFVHTNPDFEWPTDCIGRTYALTSTVWTRSE